MPYFIIIVTTTIIIIRSIIIMTIIIIFTLSIPGLSEAESPVQAGSAHPLITVTINPLEQDEVPDGVNDNHGDHDDHNNHSIITVTINPLEQDEVSNNVNDVDHHCNHADHHHQPSRAR